MALAMPRPVKLASGVYRLNVRLPADLATRLRGTRILLPLEGRMCPVIATDKVAISLRTREPNVAKSRFTEAYAALVRHFDGVRAGPRSLTHKEAVTLAGEVYRRRTAKLEADPTLTTEFAAAEKKVNELALAEWRYGSGELGDDEEISEDSARFLAAIQRPSGVERLAWETQTDIVSPFGEMKLDHALEHLFGSDANAVCAEKALILDPLGRRLLLREIGRAVDDVARKLARNIDGDYSPDPAANRFPPFDDMPRAVKPLPAFADEGTSGNETVAALFERWKLAHTSSRTASTLRRYGPSIASLDRWWKGRDWRLLTDQDIFDWATDRTRNGVSAATVNRNDLVAVSSFLHWPTTLAGKKLSTSNPAAGIKVEVPLREPKREKTFRLAEIAAILSLSRSVTADQRYPKASASRRWCPWLCAYSGARVQETLWIRKQDIRHEGDVWCFDLKKTKNGFARTIPVHKALIDEGFLAFVANAPDGYLFVGDKQQKTGSTRTSQELRAAELASWVRENVNLDPDVSPNHAWRHSWITYAEAAVVCPRRVIQIEC